MGVIKLSFQLVFYSAVFAAVILFIPGIPPPFDLDQPTIPPRQKLEGKLAPNDILDKAEVFVDGIQGPESVAIRGDDVYTGIEGGWIVKIANDQATAIVRIGDGCDDENPTKCGRPLGLRFDNQGKLLVADMHVGIVKVDVDTGTAEIIVPMSAEIEGGNPPNLPDDLDVDKEGNIYWSDIADYGSPDNVGLLLFGPASGRLLKYDPKTKKNVILIDKLYFANGVQLSKNEDFVAVTETMSQRVWKYYLKGEMKGQKEILVDGLPGFLDNIRPNGKGGFYISLFTSREESNEYPTFFETVAAKPLTRKLIVRLQYLTLKFLSVVDYFWQHDLVKQTEQYVKSFGGLLSDAFPPTRVIIVEIDESGEVLGTLQTKDGKMTTISEMSMGDKYAYFGSPMTKQLWRIKKEFL